ncbi:nucleotide exchange factor GrpE [candidate division WWE3 bacterium CG08_land_8_20_14_0_20_41_10]|uniref:Protein GrpE n=1 Tax=candidate division WWE3 bacterium CG08_land_8_20_14_0_20_41_10 TaxID=1975085 RepID=A0A2H0XBC1_UNCKA|nr:MAG: nucleotide exchange factor GrpE [candidate division WWE3 bacterium CG08_land_8_20_14_0_20_41_10]
MDDNKDQTQLNTPVDDVDQVKKLEEKISELENNWKRALADYKNLERRTAEEKQEFAEFSNMLLLQRLLPVVDNLEMLKKHIGDTGLIMIIKEFKQVLEDNGAVSLESHNKDFDASTMDCVETVDCEVNSDGKVVEVISEGYKFRNKILRPAKVRVGKAK